MKWLFLTGLVAVVGAVAAFAIYTFGWRDSGPDPIDSEHARAAFYATVVDGEVIARIAPGLWKVRRGDGEGCYAIDLDKFDPGSGGGYHGLFPADC